MWNDRVNQKALEIENEIRIEENMKIAKKKAAEEAKRKAAEEKARIEEEKRRKEEERRKEAEAKAKKGINALPSQPAVDLAELYANLPVEEISVQTGYEHHSPYWEARVERNS